MNRRFAFLAAGLLVVFAAACGPNDTEVGTSGSNDSATTALGHTVGTNPDSATIATSKTTESTPATVRQATVTTVAPTTVKPYVAPTTAKPYVAPTTAKPYVPPATAKPYVPPPTSPPATEPPSSGGGCHPSYTPCIPDVGTDVDCAGGSGNGPRYVQGPVQVHGYDEYDLDRDGDGVGCES